MELLCGTGTNAIQYTSHRPGLQIAHALSDILKPNVPVGYCS